MKEGMKKRLRIVVPVALVIVVGITAFNVIKNKRENGHIRFSGNIEVTEARLGFRVQGRIEDRKVDEGDKVNKGQVLAILESSDQKTALAKAEATVAYNRAVVTELENGSRPEDLEKAAARVEQAKYALQELKKGTRSQDIERAKAELTRAEAGSTSAEAQLSQARSDMDRFEALYKKDGISKREYELYKTKFDTADSQSREAKAKVVTAREAYSLAKEGPRKEEIKRAEAAMKQAEADYGLVKKGPRKETLDQAKAQLKAAEAAFAQVKLQLSYTELVSPMDGVVLSKSAENGEFVNPGTTVIVVGDLARPWLRAYINEKNLGRVKLGDTVDVTTDAFDKTYKGKVTFISSQAEFTPKSVQTFEERVKLMYRIKIELENPDGELKPGMPADGVIGK
jgi:HlyD family secretion protein